MSFNTVNKTLYLGLLEIYIAWAILSKTMTPKEDLS